MMTAEKLDKALESTVTLMELAAELRVELKRIREELKPRMISYQAKVEDAEEEPMLIDRKRAAEILGRPTGTLNTWAQSGLLNPYSYRIAGTRRFAQYTIKQILQFEQTKNHMIRRVKNKRKRRR